MFGGGFGGFKVGGQPPIGGARRRGGAARVARGPPQPARAGGPVGAGAPQHGAPGGHYDPQGDTGGRISLGRLMLGHPGYLIASALAVLLETTLLQAGPALVQIGIDHGIARRDLTVLLIATGVFVAAVVGTGFATAVR